MNENTTFWLSIIFIVCVLVGGLVLGISQSRSEINNIAAENSKHDIKPTDCSVCVSQFNISDRDTANKFEKLNGVAMWSYLVMQDYDDTPESIDMKRKVINECYNYCVEDNGLILTRTTGD